MTSSWPGRGLNMIYLPGGETAFTQGLEGLQQRAAPVREPRSLTCTELTTTWLRQRFQQTGYHALQVLLVWRRNSACRSKLRPAAIRAAGC